MGNKHKHLSQDDRHQIRQCLDKGDSFKEIARVLGRDCTTVSKEVKARRIFEQKGCYGRPFNDCLKRTDCLSLKRRK